MKNSKSNKSLRNYITRKGIEPEIRYYLVKKEGQSTFIICHMTKEPNMDMIGIGIQGINLQTHNRNIVSNLIEVTSCPILVIP
tara:strand:- start:301 stop:549 length:249 start_codon:yes stop_codon:yes gene_type:complete